MFQSKEIYPSYTENKNKTKQKLEKDLLQKVCFSGTAPALELESSTYVLFSVFRKFSCICYEETIVRGNI